MKKMMLYSWIVLFIITIVIGFNQDLLSGKKKNTDISQITKPEINVLKEKNENISTDNEVRNNVR